MNLATFIPELLKLGVDVATKIFAYWEARKANDEAAAAAIRAQAHEDEQKYFDAVDEHLLDNNAKVDELADEKFGKAPAAGVMVTAKGPVELAEQMRALTATATEPTEDGS